MVLLSIFIAKVCFSTEKTITLAKKAPQSTRNTGVNAKYFL